MEEEFDSVDVDELDHTFVADSAMTEELPDFDTTCSVCYAEFLDSDDLELHMMQVHGVQSIVFMSCPFCSVNLSSLEHYALHLRDTHLRSLRCCKYCMRAYIDYDLLRKHEAKHYNMIQRSMYSCSNCSKLFTNIVELEKHEFENHNRSSDGVLLQNCLSLLSSLLNIKAIKFLKAYGDDTVYLCVKCKHMTADIRDYLDHLINKNCRSFVCDICSNVYDSKHYLVKHLQKSKRCNLDYQNQDTKQCTKCYQYFNHNILKAHYRGCKPIKCKTCNIVFDSTYELSIHQNNEHPITALVRRCEYCTTDFVGESALEKHIERVHKPQLHLYKYFCSYCPKRQVFKHPKFLFAHFFSKHKDIEPYNCTICNKKFKVRKRFTLHIKLDHKSIGSVEFDDKFNVLFSNKITTTKPNSDNSNLSLQKAPKLLTDKTQDKVDVYMSPEVESEVETETVEKQPLQKTQTRKHKMKTRNSSIKHCKYKLAESSEDEPLLVVKKRIKKIDKNRYMRRIKINDETKRYICSICKKNCKNAENHRRHFYSHCMRGTKTCIKCKKNFKTSKELTDHITSQHSTSKLTDTLKKLLEQRKQNTGGFVKRHEISSELFRQTIKKVPVVSSGNAAILTEVEKDVNSVQSFIKNFIPDANENNKKNLTVTASVTVKTIKSNIPQKKKIIKMVKFTTETNDKRKTKLSMPVRFKPTIIDQPTVSIKIVEKPVFEDHDSNAESGDNNDGNHDEDFYHEELDEGNQSEIIPDVAQEVMVDETEKIEKSAPQPRAKIIIPELPKYHDISIAHLQPTAPYYKIVKVNDILQENKKKRDKKDNKKPVPIQLPSGARLVNVNPLAHLLGDQPLENIVKKTKYYKYEPKIKPSDIQTAITKALVDLETKGPYPKKKKLKTAV